MRVARNKPKTKRGNGSAIRHPRDPGTPAPTFDFVGDPADLPDAFFDALARILLDAVDRDMHEGASNENPQLAGDHFRQ